MRSLTRNVELVRRRIQQACERAGRPTSSVTLVAVTKGVTLELIREATALGLTDLGENRVQEAQAKRSQLTPADPQLRWHLIGHLQRNKAKQAVRLFDVVHSVDSLALLDELRKAVALSTRPPLPIFLQVNVSGEATKFGCAPEAVSTLARAAAGDPAMPLAGLMTIAPLGGDPEQARPHFRRLRELRDDVAGALACEPSTLRLSMGMSQDFEVAIEEGADFVRVGTAIFGARGA